MRRRSEAQPGHRSASKAGEGGASPVLFADAGYSVEVLLLQASALALLRVKHITGRQYLWTVFIVYLKKKIECA